MKQLILLFLFPSMLQASDTLKIATTPKEVTVFLNGAQLDRQDKVTLAKGLNVIKFQKLSPYIDPKSIQFATDNATTVLSVKHQYNYTEKEKLSTEVTNLNDNLAKLNREIALKNVAIKAFNEEISFLQANKVLAGKDKAPSFEELKATSLYYGQRLKQLSEQELHTSQSLDSLNRQAEEIKNSVAQLTAKDEPAMSEIVLEVMAARALTCLYTLSYYVYGASWLPKYDIRYQQTDKPIVVSFKAEVKQATKERWDNVKLFLSSSNPSHGNVAPALVPYFLSYGNSPFNYRNTANNNEAYGMVVDQNNVPIFGATIVVDGTTIGTATDFDGKFSLVLPSNNRTVRVSYLGYIDKKVTINNKEIIIVMDEEHSNLDEVVVRSPRIAQLQQTNINAIVSTSAGVSSVGRKTNMQNNIQNNTIIEGISSFIYEIENPYTIETNSLATTVDVSLHEVAASFKYFCAPRADNSVYLLATITDLEPLKLLDGEASLFFENNYVGKSLVQLHKNIDTLIIPFGKDKNIVVERNLIKSKSSTKFLSSKVEEAKYFEITVKNQRNHSIDLELMDQFPVTKIEDISVSHETSPKGEVDENTGFVVWKTKMDGQSKQSFMLNYVVKHPKQKSLLLE